MPKLKTSRAAAKRFKKTGTGKLVRNKAYKSHLRSPQREKGILEKISLPMLPTQR